jgi:hypothetical protein
MLSRDLRIGFLLAFALGVLAGARLASAQKKPAASATPSAAASPAAQPSGAAAANAPVEVQMLAYGGLDEISDRLATFICNKRPTKVVVLDLPSLQTLQAYDSFYANAEAIRDAFSAMANTAGAGSGVDDFADITSAVATSAIASNSETSSSFTISDPTPALILLNHLGSQTVPSCKSAYYGGVYAADETRGLSVLGGTVHAPTSAASAAPLVPVLDELKALGVSREFALSGIFPPQTSQLSGITQQGAGAQPGGTPPAQAAPPPQGAPQAGPAPAPQAPVPPAGPPNAGGGNPPQGAPQSGGQNVGQIPVGNGGAQSPQVTAFSDLDTTYNSFIAGLSTPNATTGQPLLSSILQGFRIRALLAQGDKANPIVAVYVNVAFAGGTQRDRKNLFTAVFTGDFIKYSGGVGVNVIVFKVAGDDSAILFSDLLRYRSPLKTINKPGCYNGAGTAGDNLGDLGPPPTKAPKPKACSK